MHAQPRTLFWTLLTVLALTSLFSPLSAEETDPSQAKIAVVNGSVITRAKLDKEVQRAQQRLSIRGKPVPDSQLSEFRTQTLEKLIDSELLYQESQKKGIKVDKAALDEKFKKQFPDEAKLKKILSGMNMSEAALKSEWLRGMAIREFIEREFVSKVKVTEKETKVYYDGNPDFFKQSEQVRASHILIKVDPKANKSEKAKARKTLEKIREKLKKGEDFSTLAKEYSQCPSSAKGGDLGFFGRGKMVKPFEEAAFSLEPGQVSDVVETTFGYHFIKVVEKKPKSTIPFKEVRDKIGQYLKNKKVQQEMSLYLAELKKEAKVERFPIEAPK
jgi:peptidyl-prolyl cis-trans isomerase C